MKTSKSTAGLTIFLLILLTCGAPKLAWGRLSCAALFDRANELKLVSKVDDVLTFGSAEQILHGMESEFKNLYDEPALSGAEKAHKGFEIYLQHRLKDLSPSITEKILDVLHNRTSLKVLSGKDLEDAHVDSKYVGETNSITLTVPDAYLNTVLDIAVRVHELEHAIQALSVGLNPYGIANPKHYYVHRFGEEKGAMTAESIYLNAVPQAEREKLLEQLKSNRTLPIKFTRLYIEILEASLTSSNFHNYVSRQWQQGRYSRASFVTWQIMGSSVVAIPAASAIWLAIDTFIK